MGLLLFHNWSVVDYVVIFLFFCARQAPYGLFRSMDHRKMDDNMRYGIRLSSTSWTNAASQVDLQAQQTQKDNWPRKGKQFGINVDVHLYVFLFFCRRGLSNRNIPVLCWWWFGNIGPHAGRWATHRAMALSPRHDVSQLLHSGSREESHKHFDDFIICWLRFFRDIWFDFYFKILFKTIDSWSF